MADLDVGSKRKLSTTPEKPNPKKVSLESDEVDTEQSVNSEKCVESVEKSNLEEGVDSETKEIIKKVLKDSSVLQVIADLIYDSVKVELKKDIDREIEQKVKVKVKKEVQKEVKEIKEQVGEKVRESMKEEVKAQIQGLKEEIVKKDMEIKNLIGKIESRAEEQEQYSRRNCLRFSNIPFKKDDGSEAEFASDMNTDKIVLDICNNSLGLTAITTDDISRTHVVGTPSDGKCQIIARFNSYRLRHKVFSAKAKLKDDPDKRFITEDLTKTRYAIVKRLSGLWKAGKIKYHWTLDGRIFMRVTEKGPKILIKKEGDVDQHIE